MENFCFEIPRWESHFPTAEEVRKYVRFLKENDYWMAANKLKQHIYDNIRTASIAGNEYTNIYLEDKSNDYYIFIHEIAPSLYSKGYKIYGKLADDLWVNCNTYDIIIDWGISSELSFSPGYRDIYNLDKLTSSMTQEQRNKEVEVIHMPCE